jgi:hypothetical protein
MTYTNDQLRAWAAQAAADPAATVALVDAIEMWWTRGAQGEPLTPADALLR